MAVEGVIRLRAIIDGKEAVVTLGQLKGGLDSAGASAAGAGKKASGASKLWNQLKTSIVALGSAYLGMQGIRTVISGYIEDARGMGHINELLQLNRGGLQGLQRDLEVIGEESGANLGKLQKGYYDTISAGIDAADANAFLRTSVQLAQGTYGDTSQAVDVLTTSINSYNDTADNAKFYADNLAMAVKLGKTTISEIAPVIARVTPLAAKLGLGFDGVAAMMASVTKAGVPTNQAVTGINRLLNGLMQNQSKAAEMGGEVAENFTLQALKAKGLQTFLTDLDDVLEGDIGKWQELAGGVRGLLPALIATGDGADGAAADLAQFGDAAVGASEAMAEGGENVGRDWDRMKNVLLNTAKSLGTILVPVLIDVGKFLGLILSPVRSVMELFEKIPGPVKTVVAGFTALMVIQGKYGVLTKITAFLTKDLSKSILFTNISLKSMGGGLSTAGGKLTTFGAKVKATTGKLKDAATGSTALAEALKAGLAAAAMWAIGKILELGKAVMEYVRAAKSAKKATEEYYEAKKKEAAESENLARIYWLERASLKALVAAYKNGTGDVKTLTKQLAQMGIDVENLEDAENKLGIAQAYLNDLNTRGVEISKESAEALREETRAATDNYIAEQVKLKQLEGTEAFYQYKAQLARQYSAADIAAAGDNAEEITKIEQSLSDELKNIEIDRRIFVWEKSKEAAEARKEALKESLADLKSLSTDLARALLGADDVAMAVAMDDYKAAMQVIRTAEEAAAADGKDITQQSIDAKLAAYEAYMARKKEIEDDAETAQRDAAQKLYDDLYNLQMGKINKVEGAIRGIREDAAGYFKTLLANELKTFIATEMAKVAAAKAGSAATAAAKGPEAFAYLKSAAAAMKSIIVKVYEFYAALGPFAIPAAAATIGVIIGGVKALQSKALSGLAFGEGGATEHAVVALAGENLRPGEAELFGKPMQFDAAFDRWLGPLLEAKVAGAAGGGGSSVVVQQYGVNTYSDESTRRFYEDALKRAERASNRGKI